MSEAHRTCSAFGGLKPAAARDAVSTVMVTGAGQGIGLAVAKRLAAEGYAVAAVSRTPPSGFAGERVRNYALDVDDAAACCSVIAEAERDLGPIDALVACAAIYRQGWFLDQKPAEFNAHFRTNVEGVANSVRAVLPGMLQRNLGRIIVMSSLADMRPLPGSLAYSVSKGALHALVRGIAGEIDPGRYPNVLINEFVPGATRTQMSAGGHPPEVPAEALLAYLRAPGGSATGRLFYLGKEIRLNESWKETLKRLLLRR